MQRGNIKQILYIGNKLSKKGSTVTSIETLGNFLKKEGFSVFTFSSLRNKFLRILEMMAATIFYSRKVSVVLIDTYSTQNFYYAVVIAKLCNFLKIPYVPILRGGNLPKRLKKSRGLSKGLFNNAWTNVAPSAYLMEKFKAAGFKNLTYIPNTIEIKKYPFKPRQEIKAKLLWVRSFSEIYNPLLALQIVELLKKEGLEVELCMVGPEKDGSLQRCKSVAQELNLPITFPGILKKEEWIDLSKDYDIFINTTNFDNMPVSVMEAMALGLPVVSTNVGGLPYLIETHVDGILLPPNDHAKFVEAVKGLLENPLKVENISNAARMKMQEFDWQQVKHRWNALFENIP